jgi:NAD-dependent dihydropyrimidine dehydrogenase PreA subunit
MGAVTVTVTPPAQPPVCVTSRCTGCGACLLTCPEHAFRPTGRLDEPLAALVERCTGCGECVEICPADAIEELT